MPNTTEPSAPFAAPRVFQTVIRAPVADVWRELTRTDAPIKCFFNSRMHLSRAGLAPGSRMAMRTPDGRHTGVFGELLEVVLLRRLSHTFRFTNESDPPCVVTYELKEVPGGTEFTLTITQAVEGSRTLKQMMMGGPFICKTLKAVVETGRPTLGGRLFLFMIGLFPPPKKSESTNWPVD
jgi:uncharacterized protein YndB with AHSA1/START domain